MLVYGEEGAGKTNFILSTLSLSSFERAVYISTEGSSYLERANQLSLLSRDNILFADAIDNAHLIELVASIALLAPVDVLAIDSINFHYRSEANNLALLKQFMSLLALLRNYARCGVFVLAVAQVRESHEDIEPAGMQYLKPWADVIMRVEVRSSHRVAVVEKPAIEREFAFRITASGIEWI